MQMSGVRALTMLPSPEVLRALMNESNCSDERRSMTMALLAIPGTVRMPTMCWPAAPAMYDTYGAVACLTP